MSNLISKDYKNWLLELKSKISSAQIKTALSVNRALICFYWDLGKTIAEKQSVSKWGDKILDQVSKDLIAEFPNVKGLSKTNLKYCKSFYVFYQNVIGQQAVDQFKKDDKNDVKSLIVNDLVIKNVIGQQAVDYLDKFKYDDIENLIISQIPWGHNIQIFTKSKSIREAIFYVQQTISNNWSRNVLATQIKSNLYGRQGKSVNNFEYTLPKEQSDLAQQTLKDPYTFDFLALSKPYKEKELEDQLLENLSNFLLELGKGFAFIGRQHRIKIGNKDYILDLLFYHVILKCYVVIELKIDEFEPEFAGKMNFYLNGVDQLLKQKDDKPTIGILICREKDNTEVEFSLRGNKAPIGVSEFQFKEIWPEELKSNLPTIAEIENELKNYT